MLCKCHWIVLYTVHFTAFCLGGGRFFRSRCRLWWSELTTMQEMKKVWKPYNAVDARYVNFPWQHIAVLNLFLTTTFCESDVPRGRRRCCWVGRWYVLIGCQYKPLLYLAPFDRSLRCKFWLGVISPQFGERGGPMGLEMGPLSRPVMTSP